MSLPILLDEFDAIEHYRDDLPDAHKAYIIAELSRHKFTNKQIRDKLKIEHNYTVSQLRSAGLTLTQNEFELWEKNSNSITLGHIRAIIKYDEKKRDSILRDILSKKYSVRYVESLATKSNESNADIKRYENEMSLQLGCEIKIKYDPLKNTGTLTLPFYSFDDLDDKATKLGYKQEENY